MKIKKNGVRSAAVGASGKGVALRVMLSNLRCPRLRAASETLSPVPCPRGVSRGGRPSKRDLFHFP